MDGELCACLGALSNCTCWFNKSNYRAAIKQKWCEQKQSITSSQSTEDRARLIASCGGGTDTHPWWLWAERCGWIGYVLSKIKTIYKHDCISWIGLLVLAPPWSALSLYIFQESVCVSDVFQPFFLWDLSQLLNLRFHVCFSKWNLSVLSYTDFKQIWGVCHSLGHVRFQRLPCELDFWVYSLTPEWEFFWVLVLLPLFLHNSCCGIHKKKPFFLHLNPYFQLPLSCSSTCCFVLIHPF